MTLLKLRKSLVLAPTGVDGKPLILKQQVFNTIYDNGDLILIYDISTSILPQIKFLNKQENVRSKSVWRKIPDYILSVDFIIYSFCIEAIH